MRTHHINPHANSKRFTFTSARSCSLAVIGLNITTVTAASPLIRRVWSLLLHALVADCSEAFIKAVCNQIPTHEQCNIVQSWMPTLSRCISTFYTWQESCKITIRSRHVVSFGLKFATVNISFKLHRPEIDIGRMHIYETRHGRGPRRKSIHARILSSQSWQNKSLQQAQVVKWWPGMYHHPITHTATEKLAKGSRRRWNCVKVWTKGLAVL